MSFLCRPILFHQSLTDRLLVFHTVGRQTSDLGRGQMQEKLREKNLPEFLLYTLMLVHD